MSRGQQVKFATSLGWTMIVRPHGPIEVYDAGGELRVRMGMW
jgi:hypothetical protein